MDSQMKRYIEHYQYLVRRSKHLPLVLLLAMVFALLLLDAILPLRSLWFHDALLTRLGTWPILLTHILFPHQAIMPYIPAAPAVKLPVPPGSWKDTALLLAAFLNVFLLYLLALRLLPQRISYRYILSSTLLLGILCVLIPVVASTDVFSYIVYARLGVVYHLNPLTSLPTAIQNDPIYHYLSWHTQPSVYGPVWTLITCFFQWLALSFGHKSIVMMVLALRIVALVSHLGSTWLIWSISGHLERRFGFISLEKRLAATLAFAWNPLLLFEAGVNAHNDATLLLCILLSTWFLVRRTQITTRDYMLAAAVFALAMCIKLNVILLAPGLLLFLWMQPHNVRNFVLTTATSLGIIILLYAPFWQNGAALKVFEVNPAIYRNVNSPAEFLSYLYNGIYNRITDLSKHHPITVYIGSESGHVTHLLSMVIFLILYGILLWRASHAPHRIDNLPELFRWQALAWLLYCAFGAPWFWPWYAVTFFGLFALIEVTDKGVSFGLLHPFVVRIFTFSLLSVYCFLTWKPLHTVIPELPGFLWTYVRGLWIWILPLLALLAIHLHSKFRGVLQKLSMLARPHIKRAYSLMSSASAYLSDSVRSV